MKFIVWGVGKRGKNLFYHIGEKIVAFIDMDNQKQGNMYYGRPVISYETYKKEYSHLYIIISCSPDDEIVNLLKKDNLNRYFRLFDCPKEIQNSYPRDYLRRYISNYVQKGKKYGIYGFNLYAFILYDWIKDATGEDALMIKPIGTSETQNNQIKEDFKGYSYVPVSEKNDIDELLVTSEDDIEILLKYYESNFSITNVFDCTDYIEEYHNVNIEKYKNLHTGKRCFIVATGPSLTMQDLNTLWSNKEICISMNRIWYAFDETNWRPDYYVVSDPNFFVQDSDVFKKLKVKQKFMADSYPLYWEGKHDEEELRFHAQVEYIDNLPKFSTDFARKSYNGSTVTYHCIQLAVYMGFKEIYLLGVDATTSKEFFDENSHFTKKYLERSTTLLRNYSERACCAYQAAKNYADGNGIKIFNATRGGELEIFERVNFDDLFKER